MQFDFILGGIEREIQKVERERGRDYFPGKTVREDKSRPRKTIAQE